MTDESMRQKVQYPGSMRCWIPLFTLHGTFDIKKLHGTYKMMMAIRSLVVRELPGMDTMKAALEGSKEI